MYTLSRKCETLATAKGREITQTPKGREARNGAGMWSARLSPAFGGLMKSHALCKAADNAALHSDGKEDHGHAEGREARNEAGMWSARLSRAFGGLMKSHAPWKAADSAALHSNDVTYSPSSFARSSLRCWMERVMDSGTCEGSPPVMTRSICIVGTGLPGSAASDSSQHSSESPTLPFFS